MTDTYNGKRVADMTREELIAANNMLIEALRSEIFLRKELEERLARQAALMAGYTSYGSERWH